MVGHVPTMTMTMMMDDDDDDDDVDGYDISHLGGSL